MITKKILLLPALLALFAIPVTVFAGQTDNSDGCPVGQEMHTSVDAGSGAVSNACAPIGIASTPTSAEPQTVNDLQNAKTPPQISACAGTIITRSVSDTGTCILISFVVSLGAGIVGVLTSIPWAADKILKFLIDNTVLSGGFSALYGTFSGSIGLAWTFIRDLMNIAIIGVFVFIAISIILGLQTYGQKKLIANVLIIAILINFSYLLTTIVINFSNALSTNIYSQLILKQTGSVGIGGKFLDDLRVNSISDAGATFVKTYNDGGIGPLLMHIFVSSLVAIMSGMVLLYAAFLFATRFIMLVFLLITSSAAFAAYISPATSSWWSKWWSHLFKNAFLAPILLIFMSIALNLSNGISGAMLKVAGNATFGGISTGAISNSQVALLVNYFLVLGILFAGIIIASSLSTQAAMRVTSAIPSIAIGAGSLGYGRIRAWGAVSERNRLDKKLSEKGLSDDDRYKYASKRARMDALGKKDWNLMNSSIAKNMSKVPGLKGLESGQFKVTPYGKVVDDKAKAKAAALGPGISKDAVKDIQEKAVRAGSSGKEKAIEDLAKAQHEQATANKKAADEQVKAADRAHQDSRKAVEMERDKHNELKIKQEVEKATSSNPEALKTAHEEQMRTAEQNIKKASAISDDNLKVLEQRKETAAKHMKEAEALGKEHAALVKKHATERADKAVDNLYETFAGKATRWSFDANYKNAVKKKLKSYHSDHSVSEALSKLSSEVNKDKDGGGGGH